MKEYIRLKEEKARKHGLTFSWQTATFGKVKHCEDEDDCSIDFETKFPAIVFDNTIISSGSKVCPPNESKFDFIISLDESDDEDYTVIFDVNSFSYKMIFVNNLKKTDSGNGEPLPPNFTVDCFDDLDYFNDFENYFLAIVYNDGLTSNQILKLNLLYDFFDMALLPPADQRYPWLRYEVEGYTPGIVHSYEQRLKTIWSRPVNRVHVLDFAGLTPEMRLDLVVRLRMAYSGEEQQEEDDMETVYFGIRITYTEGDDRGQYLFRHAERRKSKARLSGGHFIGRLAMHFRLPKDQRGSRLLRLVPMRTMRLSESRGGRQGDSSIGSLGLSFKGRVRPRMGDASTYAAPDTDVQSDP
uniref:Uncharacterized protein n=1 Tax=Tanacetum cinerariifolium TaxID=118510 RepID=A0A6L2N4Z4_TANCI|nr:hypothetical protein [Tanacetum cinerariifolium]